jgi:hypothetical protein
LRTRTRTSQQYDGSRIPKNVLLMIPPLSSVDEDDIFVVGKSIGVNSSCAVDKELDQHGNVVWFLF